MANRQNIRSLSKDVGLNNFFELRDFKPYLLVSKCLTVSGEETQGIRKIEDIAAQAFNFILVNQVMPTAGVSQPLSDS